MTITEADFDNWGKLRSWTGGPLHECWQCHQQYPIGCTHFCPTTVLPVKLSLDAMRRTDE